VTQNKVDQLQCCHGVIPVRCSVGVYSGATISVSSAVLQ